MKTETLTVYGIRQCDTCRKALKWLAGQGIDHQFHDFRVDGINVELLQSWMESPFADRLINRRSKSWRQLSDEQRDLQLEDQLQLLSKLPTLIKRPVFVTDKIVAVGFNQKELAEL